MLGVVNVPFYFGRGVLNVIQSVFPIHIVSGIAMLSRNRDLRHNLVSALQHLNCSNILRIFSAPKSGLSIFTIWRVLFVFFGLYLLII